MCIHQTRRKERWQELCAIVSVLLAFLLTSCNTTTTPTNNTSFQANYKLPQDIANLVPINHSISTTGCGIAPTIPLGTSVAQTVAAHPAEAEGHSTRSYILHVPTNYQANKANALVLVFHGFGGMAAGTGSSSVSNQDPPVGR